MLESNKAKGCHSYSHKKLPLLFLQGTGKYTNSVEKRYICNHMQYHIRSLLFYLLELFLVSPGLEFLFYFSLVLSSMTLLNQLTFQQILFWRKFLQKRRLPNMDAMRRKLNLSRLICCK